MDCEECQALRRELAEAYGEAWESCDQATKDAWAAMYKLIGGAEEDVERAIDLSGAATFRDRPRLRSVLSKAYGHCARSGHSLASIRSARPPKA
jgi:ABC-type nitrate/sulfonate/bicarbonate transport system substrate-binding protein